MPMEQEEPKYPNDRSIKNNVTEAELMSRHDDLLPGLVGTSPAMERVYQGIRLAAKHDVRVVITGESGTGKELVARAIHQLSRRAEYPFIAVNCGAVTESLMEAELFGHVKGSFTGASSDRKGLFLEANKGTVFLDEVAEMSEYMQVKLLRVLQQKEIVRVGSNRPVPVDVRLIAATNRDLRTLVEQGRFRNDIFFRLSGFNIYTPSLRERPEDIPVLIAHFIKKFRGDSQRPMVSLDEDAMRFLCAHRWPGNVRELEQGIEVLLASIGDQPRISAEAARTVLHRYGTMLIPSPAKQAQPAIKRIPMPKDGTMDMLEGESRKEWILRLSDIGLEMTINAYDNRLATAERLGVSVGGLKKAIKKMRRRRLLSSGEREHQPES